MLSLEEFWIPLLVGAIIGAILEPFLTELLPVDLRFKMKYVHKRAGKFFRASTVKTFLTAKSSDMTENNLEAPPIIDKIRQILIYAGYDASSKASSLVFELKIGDTHAQALLTPVIEPINEKLMLTQIEIILKADCGYRRFTEQILELTQGQRKIENLLKGSLSNVMYSTTLSCELKSLYELTGLLSEYKIDTLSAKLGSKTNFDMTSDRLTVYGEDITGNVTSFLKKMITMYY